MSIEIGPNIPARQRSAMSIESNQRLRRRPRVGARSLARCSVFH